MKFLWKIVGKELKQVDFKCHAWTHEEMLKEFDRIGNLKRMVKDANSSLRKWRKSTTNYPWHPFGWNFDVWKFYLINGQIYAVCNPGTENYKLDLRFREFLYPPKFRPIERITKVPFPGIIYCLKYYGKQLKFRFK